MSRRIAIAAAVLIAAHAVVGRAEEPTPDAADAPELAPLIDKISGQEITAGHVPGAVIRVDQNGQTVYRAAFGERTLQPQQQAMTPDTIFDLASLTKVVATSTAVMQLVEGGRLDLDRTVASYWPAFGVAGKKLITVRQLLTHTSGLQADLPLAPQWSGIAQAQRLLLAERPVAPPGTRFLYSDINFIALGMLVERISGQTLDVYTQQHIFAPLGMHDTGFHPQASLLPRIAPTDLQQGLLHFGLVQDPTAARMDGVAGHAGLFSTADDLARFAQMLLNGGELDGARILKPETVAMMTQAEALPGGVIQGLGWDMSSPYSMDLDTVFGPTAYGHTGYTGTLLWIDPASRTSLIVLSSRLYPDDHGDARPLRIAVAHEVAARLIHAPVLTGIDVLAREHFAPLEGLRVGLLTHQAGRDSEGRRSIDVLAKAPGVKLVSLFSPEHGLGSDREGKVDSSHDAATGLPVYSLYGSTRHPQPDMLKGLDALVIDLQDVGVRFYTYSSTVAYVLKAAARQNLRVFVLDRPNPIDAGVVQGPLLDPTLLSFTGYFPMPLRPGMTLGELATMFNGENHIGAPLTVIPMQNYRRSDWYDDTGLAWTNPSPNLRSIDEAILYPGVGLVEAANLSVGRGTAHPFEQLGAPWIDARRLARYLAQRRIEGVRFSAVDFVPTADRYAGQRCHGVSVEITNRAQLDSARLGLELATALHRLYPKQFDLDATTSMFGSPAIIRAIGTGADPSHIARQWQPTLQDFMAIRDKYLLYR